MAAYIFTPETLKKEIDKLAKDKGFKFFIVCSDKNGNAISPSKKVPVYRIPAVMPDCLKTHNLSAMLKGFYFVGFTDESDLKDAELKEYHKALEREKEETR